MTFAWNGRFLMVVAADTRQQGMNASAVCESDDGERQRIGATWFAPAI
jgi:hypothetical protein